jgi:anti-sigma-K factor RskA
VANRTALTHQNIQELLGAHAVDAVDPDEQAAIDTHIETCDACRTEVGRHHETLTLLVSPVVPSPQLRDIILTEAGAMDRSSATPAADPPGVVSLDQARADRARRLTAPGRVATVLAAAAAIVLVVGIGFAVGRHSTPTPDLQALASQAQTQPGSRQVALRSTDGQMNATITETADGTGYLHSDGLPALASDQTYQLWAFSGADGKTPISLGVLGPNPTLSTFRADTDVTAFAVSREAGGGSVAPTDPIMSGTV